MPILPFPLKQWLNGNGVKQLLSVDFFFILLSIQITGSDDTMNPQQGQKERTAG